MAQTMPTVFIGGKPRTNEIVRKQNCGIKITIFQIEHKYNNKNKNNNSKRAHNELTQ